MNPAAQTHAGTAATGYGRVMAYTEALQKAGVLRGANRLESSSAATTISLADGKPRVLDGPSPNPKSKLEATTSSTCPI